jgi:hypothetical protein
VKIPPVDPERFHRAFDVLYGVEVGEVRVLRSMVGKTIGYQDRGETTTLELTDSPLVRMHDAVRVLFPGSEAGQAAVLRMFELFRLVAQKQVEPFTRRTEDGDFQVHEALTRAMAEVEFDERGVQAEIVLARAGAILETLSA